jgi:transcriptional regulator with XRE-family HTH domain
VNVISERFADELTEKRMRDAYLSAQTRTKLTQQIRAIRNQRGWSQGDFAAILGKPQSNVSRLESRDYGNFNLRTLFELAAAFDCGLAVEFVPYEEFLRRTADLTRENLEVPRFSRAALEPLCRENNDNKTEPLAATANQWATLLGATLLAAFSQRPTEGVVEGLQQAVGGVPKTLTRSAEPPATTRQQRPVFLTSTLAEQQPVSIDTPISSIIGSRRQPISLWERLAALEAR